MKRTYKQRNGKFKAKVALDALKEHKTLEQLSKEYSIAPTQVSTWKRTLEERASSIFESTQEFDYKGEIDRLHRILGQVTAERDFLERALNR